MFQRYGKCPRLIQQFCFSSSILVLEKRAIIAVIDAHFDGLFPRSSLARQRSAPFFPSVLQPCATTTATLCFSSVLLFDTAVAEMIAILGTDEGSGQPPSREQPKRFWKDEHGDWHRPGGWRPHKRQQPDMQGQDGWRHD